MSIFVSISDGGHDLANHSDRVDYDTVSSLFEISKPKLIWLMKKWTCIASYTCILQVFYRRDIDLTVLEYTGASIIPTLYDSSARGIMITVISKRDLKSHDYG